MTRDDPPYPSSRGQTPSQVSAAGATDVAEDWTLPGEMLQADYFLRPMTLADYDAVVALMRQTPGITFRDADSREAVARYLARNPGCSYVADYGDDRLPTILPALLPAGGSAADAPPPRELVGCIMAGHDGRRGYLHHLAVAASHLRRGIATSLVEHALTALAVEGIHKIHVDVLVRNQVGRAYWESHGWQRRDDIVRYSLVRGGGDNA